MNRAARELLAQGAATLGLSLPEVDLERLAIFSGELKKWSRKINLTAIVADDDIAVKHLVDSLTLTAIVGDEGTLLDLGSGAGFPAIPLKVALHNLTVVSVDAVEKKIFFQRHAGRLLGLDRFEALHARGEDLSDRFRSYFDWIVSRAFSDIPTFVKIVLPLLKPAGTILAMKGKGGRDEAGAAEKALAELGAEVREVMEFRLPISGDARSIIVIGRNSMS